MCTRKCPGGSSYQFSEIKAGEKKNRVGDARNYV